MFPFVPYYTKLAIYTVYPMFQQTPQINDSLIKYAKYAYIPSFHALITLKCPSHMSKKNRAA